MALDKPVYVQLDLVVARTAAVAGVLLGLVVGILAVIVGDPRLGWAAAGIVGVGAVSAWQWLRGRVRPLVIGWVATTLMAAVAAVQEDPVGVALLLGWFGFGGIMALLVDRRRALYYFAYLGVAAAISLAIMLDGSPLSVGLAVIIVGTGSLASAAVYDRITGTMRNVERRYQGLFDHAVDAMIVMNDHHRITLFNAQAETVFGYRADEVIGKPVVMLMPERFRDAHPSHVEHFAQSPATQLPMLDRSSLWGLRKIGEEFPIELTVSKSVGIHGVQVFTAVVRDITARIQAQRRLEDLVRSKDEFVASIAHELRTPLTTVVGLTRELAERPDAFSADETAEFHQLIAVQSTELGNIVDDLLVFARADIEQLSSVPERTDLRNEVEKAIVDASHHRDQRAKNVTVHGTASAWADPARVRQILRNLIVNAFRYGGESIAIYLATGPTLARVEVTDDGPQVPAEEWEGLFEPYHRFHSSLGQPEAMGLGLTISRSLARLMGGDLTYRYANRTSIFELSLPVENTDDRTPPS